MKQPHPFLLFLGSIAVAFPGIALVVKHYDKIEAFCEGHQVGIACVLVVVGVYGIVKGVKNIVETGRII